MKATVRHVRANAVAYLALFVALGGTSYAAVSLPAGSVGTRQIKNGAVTPVKLNRDAFGAYVRYWAIIGPGGHLMAHEPRAIRLSYDPGTASGVLSLGRGHQPGSYGGTFAWGCFPVATVSGGSSSPPYGGTVNAAAMPDVPIHGPRGVWIGFNTYNGSGAPYDQGTVYIVVLCPHP